MSSEISVIVFDFDGVILESADVKTRAFRELFSAHPAHVDSIVDYHEANAGISRFVKLQHIFRNILNRPLDADGERALAERFAELVVGEVIRCPHVPGALEFLRRHFESHLLFIASGTPEEELKRIVAARRLTPFFREVYGSPAEKPAILERILAASGAPRSALLFVGDGRSDWQAANAVGVEFVGRARVGRPHPFGGLGVPLVADLEELDRWLEARGAAAPRP